MGMTIDKAIDIMEHYKEYGFISQKHGRNKAISIMRKYQKIQEIATTLEWEKGVSYQSVIAMMNIRKVVEDGNDD